MKGLIVWICSFNVQLTPSLPTHLSPFAFHLLWHSLETKQLRPPNDFLNRNFVSKELRIQKKVSNKDIALIFAQYPQPRNLSEVSFTVPLFWYTHVLLPYPLNHILISWKQPNNMLNWDIRWFFFYFELGTTALLITRASTVVDMLIMFLELEWVYLTYIIRVLYDTLIIIDYMFSWTTFSHMWPEPISQKWKGWQTRWENHEMTGESFTDLLFYQFIAVDFFFTCRASIISFCYCSLPILAYTWL